MIRALCLGSCFAAAALVLAGQLAGSGVLAIKGLYALALAVGTTWGARDSRFWR